MRSLVLVVCFGLLVLAARRRAAQRNVPFDRRDALLAVSVAWGLAASLGAELLSAFHLFTRGGVLLLWASACAGATILWLWPSRAADSVSVAPKAPRLETGDQVLLVGLAALLLPAALTAWAAAPNNWDSLTYHLPRILHWIQDRGLDNYPTSILRQLTLSPGAEILLAHLRLLSGSDRLWNLVQFAAWIGAIAAASGIAARLGGGRLARIAAAVFAATLPMAILQGSSTQNDLVLAFWLLALVYFLLRSLERESYAGDLRIAGGSLALAVLTKATAYLFALPFVLWLSISLLRRRGGRAAGPLLLAGAIVLLVNSGSWVRNFALFGSPLGADYGTINEARTPAVLFSNLARNVALQLVTPSDGWNRLVERFVVLLHRPLGLGVDDPRSTWPGAQFHVPAGLRRADRPDAEEALYAMFHDGQAGNPIHLVLLAAASALVLSRRSPRRVPALRAYLTCIAAGALLFCLVLRWQPWNARLQLPLFLLAAPLAGVALSPASKPAWTRRGCFALLLLGLPWAIANATRPLVGDASVLTTPRIEQFFAEMPDARSPFLAAGRTVREMGCREVGLRLRGDDPEYLLWVALEPVRSPPWRIEHVDVPNRSQGEFREARFSGFDPCAVIALETGARAPGQRDGVVLSEDWSLGRVTVMRRR